MELDESLQSGPHAALRALLGSWAGTMRTWFMPGDPVGDHPIEGTIRSAASGMFVVHEYRSTFDGKPLEGIALHGYNLGEARYETAWADSFHTGTSVMVSLGDATPGISVLGHYGDGRGGPEWGWRTTLRLDEPDRLLIQHDNIKPDGETLKAVEIDYRRAG